MIGPALLLALALGPLAAVAPLSPCILETQGLGRTEALCGTVTVKAHDAAGREIDLSIGFGVLEATGSKKAADPVVLLPGGPGQASTELAGVAERAFAKTLRERDVVLFDPRGTGRSLKLSCKNDKRTMAEELLATDEESAALLEECARTLPLDPKEITTAHIARDLEAVRAALGVERWNLVGISYGTRLALAYDRAFPGRARSLVLDGVVPFSMRVGAGAAADALASLQALDARCRAAPGCAPDAGAGEPRAGSLVDIVTALKAQLDAQPADVTLAHPTTGRPLTLRIDGDVAVGVVRLLIYAEETAAILPPILRAAAAGDLRPLAAQLVLGEKLEDSMSQPMQLSVLCSEDIPPDPATPPSASAPTTGAAPTGAGGPFPDFVAEMAKACARWPRGAVDPRFHDDEPASPTPALLLSGQNDPVTPPAYGEIARRTVPNSKHVVGNGIGHNVIFRGCVPELVARFIAQPTFDGKTALDVTCTEKLGPFPVFVDAMGPSP